MRVLRGDLQRGDGFQAGLDALLLSAVPDAGVEAFLLSGRLALASDVVSSGLQPVDRSLPAAAALALAALGAWRRGGGDISAGGRRGVQHLEPSDRNDGEQTVGLLLGVKREVAEDVLVMRTGSTRQTGSQAASLILKRHIGSVSWSFNTARISSHVKIYYSCSNVRKTALFSKKKKLKAAFGEQICPRKGCTIQLTSSSTDQMKDSLYDTIHDTFLTITTVSGHCNTQLQCVPISN